MTMDRMDFFDGMLDVIHDAQPPELWPEIKEYLQTVKADLVARKPVDWQDAAWHVDEILSRHGLPGVNWVQS